MNSGALFPTFIFAAKMLPLFDLEPNFGPKTKAWYDFLLTEDVGAKIFGEVGGALDGWEAKGRWDTIHGAGLRDAELSLFDKIVAGDIPSDKVYEDDYCYAFKDISPAAPVHAPLGAKLRRSADSSNAFGQGTTRVEATSKHAVSRRCCSCPRTATASRSCASRRPSTRGSWAT